MLGVAMDSCKEEWLAGQWYVFSFRIILVYTISRHLCWGETVDDMYLLVRSFSVPGDAFWK